MVEGLNMDIQEFSQTYLREISIGGFKRISLKEKDNFDCIFWENGGCSIYKYRPSQCRSFPFWSAIIADEESWQEAAKNCPGINSGTLHSAEEIKYWLDLRKKEPFISSL